MAKAGSTVAVSRQSHCIVAIDFYLFVVGNGLAGHRCLMEESTLLRLPPCSITCRFDDSAVRLDA